MPVAKPKRILLIGDTGCRIKGKQVQACNDAELWPFQVGASIVAVKLRVSDPYLVHLSRVQSD